MDHNKQHQRPGQKKCSVRAVCLPPSRVTLNGATEVNAGDIASPVQIIIGNKTKITAK